MGWGGGGAAPWLTNTGTIDVNAASSSLRLDLPLDNQTGGLVKVRHGTLDLEGTATAGGVSVSGQGNGTLDGDDGATLKTVNKYDLFAAGHINIKPKDQATLAFGDAFTWQGDLKLRGTLTFDDQIDANKLMAEISQTGNVDLAGGTENYYGYFYARDSGSTLRLNAWDVHGTYDVSATGTVNVTLKRPHRARHSGPLLFPVYHDLQYRAGDDVPPLQRPGQHLHHQGVRV